MLEIHIKNALNVVAKMSDSETEALRRQLEALKLENQRLKGNEEHDSDRLIITEGQYNGYPTLTFQRGKKKPFNIGLKKLKAVIEGREEVERFLRKHSADSPPSVKSADDGFRIDDFLA